MVRQTLNKSEKLLGHFYAVFIRPVRFVLLVTFLFQVEYLGAQKSIFFEEAKNLIEEGKLKAAEEANYKYLNSISSERGKLDAYYEVGKLYNVNLYFDLSIDYCEEALNSKNLLREDSVDFLLLIAMNHMDLNHFNQADSLVSSVEMLDVKDEFRLSHVYNFRGEIKRSREDYSAAITSYEKSISLNRRMKNERGLAMNYNNLGLSYLGKKNYVKATLYLDSSLYLIDSFDLKKWKAGIGNSFGKLYQAQKEYNLAITYFSNILKNDISHHSDRVELLKDAHYGLFECFESIGEWRQALVHHKEYLHYNLMIFDNKKQASVFENQIMNEKEKHNEQVELIHKKNETERKYVRLYIIILCFGLVLLLFLFLGVRLRNRSIKQKVTLIENVNQIQQLQLEKSEFQAENLKTIVRENEQLRKIEILEQQELQNKIDYKNRKLTSYAAQIFHKNEILSEINSCVKTLQFSIEEGSKLRPLKSLINQSIQLDRDWELFKKHFIEVHPDFFDILLTKFPDLTMNDLKLCAYLRLKLSSKEIARLLNIETPAVNKRRNRVRKKLLIEPSVDLYRFMASIS